MKAKRGARSTGRANVVRRHAGSLLLFPGALGDAVCLEPALAELAASGPVTLYARGGAAEVARLFPARPKVRSLDAPEIARLFSPLADHENDHAAADQGDWLAGFARIVSFTGAGVPALVARLTATGRAMVAPFPRAPLGMHASDYFLRTVSGVDGAIAVAPRLLPPPRSPSEPADCAGSLVLLPGSGGSAKRAPRDLFADLAGRWRGRGGQVVVVLGPAEEGEGLAWQGCGRICRPASIADLAGALDGAAAFAGNDSGPSHVAAALGVPGVVFFTVTTAADFGPRGRAVVPIGLGDRLLDGSALDAAWLVLDPQLP